MSALARGAAALLLLSVLPRVARAEAPPDKATCATSYEHAQEQKKAGKLIEAKRNLLVCSQASCPDFIKSDCGQWITEVDTRTPTLAISAKDAHGADLAAVEVYVDGQRIAERISGMALPVDPGAHVLRFVHQGDPAVDKHVLVREGEKARVIAVQFAARPEQAPPPASVKTPASSPSKTWAYVLGGAGVVSLGIGGAFWIAGKNAENDAKGQCAPTCTQSRIDSIRSRYLVGDVGVGIGLASLGVATYLLLHKPTSERAAAARVDVNVVVSDRATLASVAGRF